MVVGATLLCGVAGLAGVGGQARAAVAPRNVLTIDSTNGGSPSGGVDTVLDDSNSSVYENYSYPGVLQGEMVNFVYVEPPTVPPSTRQTYAYVEAEPGLHRRSPLVVLKRSSSTSPLFCPRPIPT